MPTRILRPGLTTSRRWNTLDWPAQSLYIRIITLADDFGRFDADPQILRSYAFPLRDDVNLLSLAGMCQQLADSGLVEFYNCHEGKQYLQVTKWHERARSKSKYPAQSDQICQQSADNSQQSADTCMLPTPYALRLTPSPSPHAGNARAIPQNGDAQFPTWEEVRLIAEMRAVPESSAKSFFDHHEGNNLWLNPQGKLINWMVKMVSWAATDRAKPKGATQLNSPAAELILRQKELERVEKKITSIRQSYESHQSMSKEDRDHLAKLKARRDELVKLLGMSA